MRHFFELIFEFLSSLPFPLFHRPQTGSMERKKNRLKYGMRKLQCMVLLLMSFAVNGETVTENNDEGSFSLSVDSYVAETVTARIVGKYKKGVDSYKLSIDNNEVTSFTMFKNKEKVAAWYWNSQDPYKAGEHYVSGHPSSEWILNSHLVTFAWKEPGREVPDYINGLKSKLDQVITVKDYAGGLYYLGEANSLEAVETYRIAWLEEQILNLDTQKAADTERKAELGQQNAACESIINENNVKIAQLEAAKAPIAAQLAVEKQILEKMIADGAPADQIAAQQAKVTDLEAQVQVYVKQIEDLHVENYNCEDTIKRNNEEIAKINENEANYDTLLKEYQDELVFRKEDLALVSELIYVYTPLVKKLKNGNSSSGDTTVIVKEEKNDTNWGTVFGIACIPALAIGVPVSAAIGIGYGEMSKDGKSEEKGDEDDEAVAENELDKQMENEPVKPPKRNVSVIRDLGSLKQESRVGDE